MTLISHHPAAHRRQLHDRPADGAQHHRSAQGRTKRSVKPGACSLEFVNRTGLTEDRSELGEREALPHEVDPEKMAALMLAMASRRTSGAARAYVAACIGGGQPRAVDGRDVQGGIKHSGRRASHTVWSAMTGLMATDPSVITFFVWPACVALNIVADDGSSVPTMTYAPDLVVVRQDEIVVIEFIGVPVDEMPIGEPAGNFVFAPTGNRGYPKPREVFETMGLRYERTCFGQTGSNA